MRFVFSPPADEAAGLLTLPWDQPLEDWTDDRLVEIRQRGLSRHVVRFVADSGELYALKSLREDLAPARVPDAPGPELARRSWRRVLSGWIRQLLPCHDFRKDG
jgi:hypothetical protein